MTKYILIFIRKQRKLLKVLYFHIFIERLRLLLVVARHTADIFLGNIESVLIKWEHKWSNEYTQDEAQNNKKGTHKLIINFMSLNKSYMEAKI